MIALLLALHCADDAHLRYLAHRDSLPAARVLSIARVESGCNLNPKLRAHASTRDREVGRFQIKPSTARMRCPGVNVFTYAGNVACFLKMFREDVRGFGVTDATVRHNGYGPAGAYEFLYKVLRSEERLQ